MKNKLIIILITFFGLLGCKSNIVEEKTVFPASDIKKCVCDTQFSNICYYDTVKTFLFTLTNVQGTLYSYPDNTIIKTDKIILDNPTSYINGGKEFGEPFYWWRIMNGFLSPCNMPNEIYSTNKYNKRRVVFSANVSIVLPPAKGQTYGGDGYPIILKDIKIL